MDTIKEASPFVFPFADVRIKITHCSEYGSVEYIGRVSSQAMCRASKVWEKFIYPPWSQETPSKTTEGQETSKAVAPVAELDFTEDNSEALLLLLRITHLQFKEIPQKKLEYPLLLQVAILCDLYDCVELVNPWLKKWLGESKWEASQPGHENWTFIAWVFGQGNEFNICALKMAREIKLDRDGRYLGKDRITVQNVLRPPFPPGCLGKPRQIHHLD